jgi:hypothetical protein
MQFVARVTPYGHMRLERVAYRMGVPTIDDPVAGQVDCGCTGLVPVASTSWHSQRAYDVIKACLQRERLACRNPPHDMERTFWAQGACPGILRSCCMMDRDKPLHDAGERACEGLGAGIQTM